jgi:tRNA(Glu) U13 pseudouridine synthase TruD
MQWFCALERISDVHEENFKIKYKGQSDERIFVGKHKSNEFSVNVELSDTEILAMRHFKPKKELVCNYFGEQRFSEQNIGIIEALENKDYENALKLLLTKKNKHDSEKSGKIKRMVEAKWGSWEEIKNSPEVLGTKKIELFEFLEKNPKSFEDAFMLAEPKSVAMIIKAAQAKRFNEELNKTAEKKKPNNLKAQIIGQFPEYSLCASKAFPRSITIKPTEFEKKFRKGVLERKTFFSAEKFRVKKLEGVKYELNFELVRGAYATILLIYLNKWLKNFA